MVQTCTGFLYILYKNLLFMVHDYIRLSLKMSKAETVFLSLPRHNMLCLGRDKKTMMQVKVMWKC